MGCVYSSSSRTIFRRSKDENRFHNDHELNINGVNNNSRVFNVVNVDDQGNEINSGNIEITDVDLILHQRGKNSIYWPLRSLRRYGFDADLFSFECGRRCSTGPGIYAFKSAQAEQLFNVLQESIQRCSNAALPPSFLNNLPNHITSPQHLPNIVSISSPPIAPEPGPRVSLNNRLNQHLYSNDIHEYTNTPFYVNTLKSSSISTTMNGANISGNNDIVSPLSIGPPFRLTAGNEFKSGVTDINTNYAKLDDLVRYYVNINTPIPQTQQQQQQELAPQTISQQQPPQQSQKTNKIDASSIENQSISSQPSSPTRINNEEPVNYVMLDLETTVTCSSPTYMSTEPTTPTSKFPDTCELKFIDNNECSSTASKSEMINITPPNTPLTKQDTVSMTTTTTTTSTLSSINIYPQSTARPYATIDFDKTVALSNSAANHRKLLMN